MNWKMEERERAQRKDGDKVDGGDSMNVLKGEGRRIAEAMAMAVAMGLTTQRCGASGEAP